MKDLEKRASVISKMNSIWKPINRAGLFTKIRKTSYVGDINTLYTHVNFLRDAETQDPSALCYLHTARGKRVLAERKLGRSNAPAGPSSGPPLD